MTLQTLLRAYGEAHCERYSLMSAMDTGAHYASYYRTYPERIARRERLMQRIEQRLLKLVALPQEGSE